MFTCNRIVIFLGVVIACSSCATAFFLNWGSSEPSPIQRPLQPYPVTTFYHPRFVQQPPPPPGYGPSDGDPQQIPVQIPAIPIQVPLQAQLSPTSNVQNVQLVPCLCPVSPDLDYGGAQEGSSSVLVNQIKNPQK